MGVIKLQDSSIEIEAFAFKDVFKFIERVKPKTIVRVELENKDGRYQILSN